MWLMCQVPQAPKVDLRAVQAPLGDPKIVYLLIFKDYRLIYNKFITVLEAFTLEIWKFCRIVTMETDNSVAYLPSELR